LPARGHGRNSDKEGKIELRDRLSYANVMATVAVFIALGGTGYAMTKLPKNSVGAKQLKKNAVTSAKIRKETITAAKIKKGSLTGTQVNASTLGTVPTAQSANTASSLAPSEDWHEVGSAGEPPFLNGWKNFADEAGPGLPTVAFYKDHEGIVRLRGTASAGTTNKPVFQLPPGYRPAAGTSLKPAMYCVGATCPANLAPGTIFGSGVDPAIVLEGGVYGRGDILGFDPVTFRAES